MCASTWSWLGRRVEKEVLRKARDHLEAVKQVAEVVETLFKKFREGDVSSVTELYNKTYELEKKADDYKREVIRELSEGYLHPIDREELIRLVLINDDIAAYLKAAGKRATLVDPNAVPENIREILVKMASGVREASTLLLKAVEIVRSDPKEALRLADEVERIEESIDDIRMEGMKEVLGFCDEVGKVSVCIITKELVDELENSSDECENSADVIRSIAVMHA